VFNFPHSDRRDRLLLKVADSKFSKPMSFDSPAADMAVVMQTGRGDKEYHVGLSYTEGLGKVSLAPSTSAELTLVVQVDQGRHSHSSILGRQ
jgi:vacuolar protein sorting-associated protein 13A/C